MSEEELKRRIKQFALRVIKLVSSLPKTEAAKVIGNQLLRAGTSVGANYRAACFARSQADFISKLGIVLEECDESLYWMELLVESEIVKEERMKSIMKEATELTKIFIASLKTSKRNNVKSKI
ncbi:MAG: four helix bundle protein [Ignavibacteriales bacterium]|nr:four helix bundle protein [Ignavibacteriales bacterium]